MAPIWHVGRYTCPHLVLHLCFAKRFNISFFFLQSKTFYGVWKYRPHKAIQRDYLDNSEMLLGIGTHELTKLEASQPGKVKLHFHSVANHSCTVQISF